jgi:hypothetical protein
MSDNAAADILVSFADALHKRAVQEEPVQTADSDLLTGSGSSGSSGTPGPQKRVRTANKRLEGYVSYSDASEADMYRN